MIIIVIIIIMMIIIIIIIIIIITIFGTKHKLRNAKSSNIVYNGIEIKQYAKVKYPGCILD